MKNNTVLHYKKGSSDKVYIVSITQAGSACEVTAKNGRIYKKMQSHDKGVFNSRSQAETQAQTVIASKKKKGYVDIESVAYDGPLTPTDSWLKTWLAPEPANVIDPMSPEELEAEVKKLLKLGYKDDALALATDELGGEKQAEDYIKKAIDEMTPKAKPVPNTPDPNTKDWEVTCINALGMEDGFDEGMTYIAEAHADDDMVYVWDRNGEKRECFKERFEKSA